MDAPVQTIDESTYRRITELLPIPCVDVVVRSTVGVLLVRRNQHPLKGYWWVVGGRIWLGEAVLDAVRRKCAEEIGVEIAHPRFAGFYHDIYVENSFGQRLCSTVSLVYEGWISESAPIKLNEHHSEWKWGELPERLKIVRTGDA